MSNEHERLICIYVSDVNPKVLNSLLVWGDIALKGGSIDPNESQAQTIRL